ncbi:MAG: hypothetical protein DWQ05_22650 [Calditrichaeota bacterium]|nr:MAG: hypothetical protein DWQ05_22650 [Calditrichota bacterium]
MGRINYWQIIKSHAYANAKINQSAKLESYAYELLVNHGTIEPLDAERYCTKNLKIIGNKFAQLIDDDKKRGVTPPLILGSGYICLWHPQNTRQEAVWTYRNSLLRKLAEIDDDSFEALCCYAIESIGGISFKTKSKSDGGVDGYALLSNQIDNHIFGQKKINLKIVGQFKNYNHKEVVTKFESFIQTINNVRYMSERIRSEMPSFFSSAKGPIVGWYVCKSGFQVQVYDQAKWHGIIISDLIDIVELLCNIVVYPFGDRKTKLLLNVFSSLKAILNNC